MVKKKKAEGRGGGGMKTVNKGGRVGRMEEQDRENEEKKEAWAAAEAPSRCFCWPFPPASWASW